MLTVGWVYTPKLYVLTRLASNKSTKATHRIGYSYGFPTDLSEDLEELDLDTASIIVEILEGISSL